jgi:DNA processing protein
MDDLLWLALSRVRGIGIKKLIMLDKASISYNDLGSLLVGKILGKQLYEVLNQPGYIEHLICETELDISTYKQRGVDVISYTNPKYPELLGRIPDPPVTLYCKGNVESLGIFKKIAVIGTRRPTSNGYESAEQIAAAFAENGWVIVSGLATGIDTAAHKGALKAGGATIAVLPGSLDNIYPEVNRGLAEEIVKKGGLLVTEYPWGTRLQKRFFVERDRIQSALSLGVCVVQTEMDGGAMHTANFCKSYNKPVFCLKTAESIKLPQYSGVVKLLEEGAVVLNNTPEGIKQAQEVMLNNRYYKKVKEILG